jgi:two-component system response regulator YesN
MEVVGVAHNSLEALDVVKAHMPDILLTDIRMPGYDGLELITRARDIKSDLDFVIISGYRNFEYAKKAIQFQVQDYILKPVRKDDLCAVLQKMRTKYLNRTRQTALEAENVQRLRNDTDLLRSGYINEFIAKKEARYMPRELNEKYHFHFEPGVFQLLIAKTDCLDVDQYNNAAEVLSEKLILTMRKNLEKECFDTQFALSESRVYGLINYRADARGQIRKSLKIVLDDFHAHASVFGEITLTIGIGEPLTDTMDLARSLSSAESALTRRLLENTGVLIEGEPCEAAPESHQITLQLMSSLKNSVYFSLETLDKAQLKTALSEYRERFFAIEGLTGYMAISAVNSIHESFFTLVSVYFKRREWLDSRKERFFRVADMCPSADALFDLLSRELYDIFEMILDERQKADAKPMRLAKRYIHENYASQITLNKIAEITGFNPTYFSTLFKQETGKNYLEYLSEVRIGKACDYLKDTNKTVAAICEEVGYSDLKHFSKNFKKYTGLSPNEYRRLFA